MSQTRTLEPTRERWEFDARIWSEIPGLRSITAVDLEGHAIHGVFAHVVTAMKDGATEKSVTQRANLIVNAPELLELADRFFSFYELHKSARGGALGRQYQELRTKIMGAPSA